MLVHFVLYCTNNKIFLNKYWIIFENKSCLSILFLYGKGLGLFIIGYEVKLHHGERQSQYHKFGKI